MNRLIRVGLAIAVAPALLLAYGKVAQSPDVIVVSEMALFRLVLPVGAVFVVLGLIEGRKAAFDQFVMRFSAQVRPGLDRALARGRSFCGLVAQRAARLSPKAWFGISLSLFVLALAVPFCSDNSGETFGVAALLVGWLALPYAWLANPLLWLAWLCLANRWWWAGLMLVSASLLLAISFIHGPEVTTGWGEWRRTREQAPAIGYFVWLASIACALLAATKGIRARGTAGAASAAAN